MGGVFISMTHPARFPAPTINSPKNFFWPGKDGGDPMAVKQFDVMSLGRAGLFDPGEMGYRDSLDIIKEESVKIQKSFVKIGWYLKHIQDNELYREDGYENISECAAEQFGYSQSTVSRFIAICEKFSKDHNSPELDERYSGFDKSQMMEMLPMSPEQLESVTPDMTVRQIRDIKDSRRGKQKDENDAKETKEAEEEKLPGQTSIEEDFRSICRISLILRHPKYRRMIMRRRIRKKWRKSRKEISRKYIAL